VLNSPGLILNLGYWSMTKQVVDLTPGLHTVSVRAAGVGLGVEANVSGPRGNSNQGQLTVTTIKR
jgi:hypothetical protein